MLLALWAAVSNKSLSQNSQWASCKRHSNQHVLLSNMCEWGTNESDGFRAVVRVLNSLNMTQKVKSNIKLYILNRFRRRQWICFCRKLLDGLKTRGKHFLLLCLWGSDHFSLLLNRLWKALHHFKCSSSSKSTISSQSSSSSSCYLDRCCWIHISSQRRSTFICRGNTERTAGRSSHLSENNNLIWSLMFMLLWFRRKMEDLLERSFSVICKDRLIDFLFYCDAAAGSVFYGHMWTVSLLWF